MDNASEAPWSINFLLYLPLQKGIGLSQMRYVPGSIYNDQDKVSNPLKLKKIFFSSTLLHFMAWALQIKLAENRLTKYKQFIN